MSNSVKCFLACLVVVMIGDVLGAVLGMDTISITYGFAIGMIWSFVYDHFMKPTPSSSQVQIVKDGNTIQIQASGDITVRSEIVDR